MSSILIADDDKTIAWSLQEALTSQGYDTLTAQDGRQALKILEESSPDLILLDLRLPEVSGMEILRKLNAGENASGAPQVIMITGYADVKTAVEAMQLGALDYVEKPFNLDELRIKIAKAMETMSLKQEVSRLRKAQNKVDFVVGSNGRMKAICETIAKVAASPATTVLIEGESGTGKELVARSVHNMSARRNKPFIAINCTALPENLLEAELFGYEKGAFTDARQDRKGMFEQAHEGSLFLDEIGDMSLGMQAKMLRALQEKKIRRVGGSRDISIDIRVIASTNKNLERQVGEGAFREDLYYRLKVIPIRMPSLRERREDLPQLCEHFIGMFNREFGKNVQGLDPEAQAIVSSYDWPGNIRELKNVIERAILLETRERIMAQDLSLHSSFACAEGTPACGAAQPVAGTAAVGGDIDSFADKGLDEVEKLVIERCLKNNNGNKNLVAKKLQINRTTLYNKIKKYNLE